MWDVRTITSSEIDLFRQRFSRGFGEDHDTDEASRERFDALFDIERTLAAFDDGDMIGTCSGFSLGLTVPGGADVPMGGTTVISVQPTHRRRGVLRALMDRHLTDVEDRGEPLAGLWASEASIYGRFGYAPATYRYRVVMDGRSIDLPDPGSGEQVVRFLVNDELERVLPGLYENVRPTRAGMLTRSEAWWTHRLLADPETWRQGRSAHRHVVVEVDGEPYGYASYRQKEKWEDFTAAGTVHVSEVMALTASARLSLWRFLTNIDLFPSVEWWNMPTDDPLPAATSYFRNVRRTLADSLWVRLIDVRAALEAREYEEAGEVVFEVTDRSRPNNSGVYRLSVEDGRASCERDPASDPMLRFDIDVLGHLYLGGGNALSMAAVGRIEGEEGAVMTLHRLFRTVVAPWCPDVF